MGEIILREPLLEEFEVVQDVFQDVWDMNIIREIYASQLYNKEAAIFAAYLDEEIVGAVSCFMTINNRGKKRWEVDLVAVKKDAQRKGIGAKLVQKSIERGRELGAVYARALVRIENTPSQKIFEKAGFTKNEEILNLILWQPWIFKNRVKKDKDITFLAMDTLGYRGLWIEDLFAKEKTPKEYENIINYAQQYVYEGGRENTGATLLREDINKLPKNIVKQSANHGKYNWWSVDLT